MIIEILLISILSDYVGDIINVHENLSLNPTQITATFLTVFDSGEILQDLKDKQLMFRNPLLLIEK